MLQSASVSGPKIQLNKIVSVIPGAIKRKLVVSITTLRIPSINYFKRF